MRARTTITALALTASALALAGCGGTSGAVSPTVTVTKTVEAGATEPSATDESTPAEVESTPAGAQATFGQTYTYADGLAVTVSKPVAYKPSEYAACDKAKAYRVWTITVKNGTKAVYDPSAFNETVQSGQSEASSCYDSGQGIGGSPDTKLLAGRTVTWKRAYGVADPNDIVMEVRAGFDYDSAIFTS